jgi:hypothetical protein
MTDRPAISCEREFLQVLRARREALGVGYETLEALCDLPSGYAGKLLLGVRPVGALTLWLLLQSLGLRIRVEEDPEALERNRRRHEWLTIRRKPKKRRWTLREIAIARRRNAPWLFDSERAREAGRKSALMRKQKAAAASATIVGAD